MTEDLRLSVSKTKTFLDCKAKYKFCYIEKLPRKDWDFHTFGKFCHSVLEHFHQQYIDGCPLPYNVTMGNSFKHAWAEYKDKMTPEMKKECWAIVDQYLRLITKDKQTGLPANVIKVEKRFDFQIADNLVLNGAIDRIQLDADNVIHVADYKTTKNKKYLKNDFFQLLTYAYVLVTEDPSIEKVRASYILLRHNFEYMTTEFSKKEILAVKDKFVEYADKMLTEKEFTPNPTGLCNYCDYLQQCPAGKSRAYDQPVYGEVNW
jgi:RecB family exonuclease